MIVNGTVGASTVIAEISQKKVSFSGKKKLCTISPLHIVCFQRVDKRLKMCDIIYVDVINHSVVEQTIERVLIDQIQDVLDCAIYVLGRDPLPWKRFTNDAKRYQWSLEDWQHLFEASTSDSEEDQCDSEWAPGDISSSSESSSSEDEHDSDEDAERPRKRPRS